MLTQFPLAPSMRGAVLALGNFDGFHVGHQAVVSHASTLARRDGRLLLVATFDPHPVRYFNPAAEPFLLSSLVQRPRLFREFGADDTVAIPFDAAIAALPADAFVAQWLGDKLRSEERRVGKECVSMCRSRWSTYTLKPHNCNSK